jgi:hypothetical protein
MGKRQLQSAVHPEAKRDSDPSRFKRWFNELFESRFPGKIEQTKFVSAIVPGLFEQEQQSILQALGIEVTERS